MTKLFRVERFRFKSHVRILSWRFTQITMRRLDIRDVDYWVSTLLRGINVFSLIRKLWIILALEKNSLL